MPNADLLSALDVAIQYLGKMKQRKSDLEHGEYSTNKNVRKQTMDLMKTDLLFVKDALEKVESFLENS